MKITYKSIRTVVLLSLVVLLLAVSVAEPVAAQDDFILTVGEDKVFTSCNWHYIRADLWDSLNQYGEEEHYAEGTIILSGPGQQAYASTTGNIASAEAHSWQYDQHAVAEVMLGVAYGVDLDGYSLDAVRDWPVVVAADFSYECINQDCEDGMAWSSVSADISQSYGWEWSAVNTASYYMGDTIEFTYTGRFEELMYDPERGLIYFGVYCGTGEWGYPANARASLTFDSIAIKFLPYQPHQPNQPPVASFRYSPESPIVGGIIRFDGSSSYDPDGGIVGYEWDFGDGTTDTGPSSEHIYRSPAKYTVTLIVTDDDGVKTSISTEVDLTLKNGDVLLCRSHASWVPLNFWTHVGIYDKASNSVIEARLGGVWHYPLSDWFFPNETCVRIVRIDTNPAVTNAAVAFASAQVGCQYDLLSIFLNMKNDLNTDRFGWYCSELVWAAYLWASNGLINLDMDAFAVGPDEIASSGWAKTIGEHMESIPDTVYQGGGIFWGEALCPIDLVITDPDGLVLSGSQNEIPGAIYAELDIDEDGDLDDAFVIPEQKAGSYSIHVIPEADASPTDTFTLIVSSGTLSIVIADNIRISEIPYEAYLLEATETEINIVPVACSGGPYLATEGSLVAFNASGSYDPDGTIVLYEWDFDSDGVYDYSSDSPEASHAWGDNCTVEVTLRVTDDDGLTSTAPATVTVFNVAPSIEPIVVDAGADGLAECGIETVFFTGSFTDPGWLDTHTIHWDFGDGETVDGNLNASHLYTKCGTFTVTLTVTDDDGGVCTDTATVTVVDTTPPTTPVVTDDGAYTTSTSQLHATWSSLDAESGIAEYRYAIGTSAGGTDTVDWTSAGTDTEVTHAGLNLTVGTTYYFAVKAKNGQGLWSGVGVSDGILISDNTAPTTPMVTDDGDSTTSATQLHAMWSSSDPESGVAEYQYAIGTSPRGTDVVDWTSAGTDTEVTKTGLSLSWGTTYYFAVKAKNGSGMWSDVGTSNGITVLDATPPTGPVVTDDGDYTTSTTQLHASWSSSDPETGVAEYQYAIGSTPGETDVVDWASAGTDTDVTKTGLSLAWGTTYYFAVKAKNGHGLWSEVTISDGITIQSPPNEPPDQPSNISPSDGATGISLTFTLSSSSFSDSDERDTHAASQWQITTTPENYSSPVFDSGEDTDNLTSITISSGTLAYSTTYYWRVRHQDNSDAWSDWSSETPFTTEEEAAGLPSWVWIVIGIAAAAMLAGGAIVGRRLASREAV